MRSHVQERCPGARRTSEFPQFLIPNICYVSAEHQVPRSERREGGRRRSWSSHWNLCPPLTAFRLFTSLVRGGSAKRSLAGYDRPNWRSFSLDEKSEHCQVQESERRPDPPLQKQHHQKQAVSHARRESRQHEATPSLHTSASSSCSHLSRPSLVQYSSRVVTCDRVRRAQRGGA